MNQNTVNSMKYFKNSASQIPWMLDSQKLSDENFKSPI